MTKDDVDDQVEANIEEFKHGTVRCKICGKVTTSKYHMRHHAGSHLETATHARGVCGKTYRTREHLQHHVNRMHSGVFSCEICGKSGMNKGSYSQHMHTTHKVKKK